MQGKIKNRLKMLPTLREKRHYLVLMSETMQDMEEKINRAILDFIGVLGYAKAGVFFVEQEKVNVKQIYFILSVVTKYVDAVKAAIALMRPKVHCIGVSGTIKKAREKFLSSLIS